MLRALIIIRKWQHGVVSCLCNSPLAGGRKQYHHYHVLSVCVIPAVMAEGKIRVEDHLVDPNNKPIQVKRNRIKSMTIVVSLSQSPLSNSDDRQVGTS